MDNSIKKECIIFGCGQIGKAAFEKLKNYYNIAAWVDNNPSLWGSTLNGVGILSLNDMVDLYDINSIDVFVSMLQGDEVVNLLIDKDIKNIYIWKNGFFYNQRGLFPLEFPIEPYSKTDERKTRREVLDVLFVSDTARIRDHKMASIVKKAGHRVFLAYLSKSPYIAYPEYAKMYDEVYPIMSIKFLQEFVSQSEFDIVHASSEPDFVTPLLSKGNKPVILDCHDLRSSNQSMTPNQMMTEYLAHTQANAIIYPTEGLRDEALKKFKRPLEDTLVIENFIGEDLIPEYRLEKLSKNDGLIHCVYEGNVVVNNPKSYKYFTDIWMDLIKAGVHVHFYSSNENEAKKLAELDDRIHYEGNISSQQLAYEMSRYDVGLAIYNITKCNKSYLEKSSPNKIYEYLNAGLPIAVNGIRSITNFVTENRFGLEIDMTGDIYEQLKRVTKICIPNDILAKRGFIFENMADKLVDLYLRSINPEA